MLLDVLRRLKTGWIARDQLILAFLLVPPDIIHAHDRGKVQIRPINPRPGFTDAKVEDEAHRLLADLTCLDVAVWANGAPIQHEHLLVADLPTYVGILAFSRHVFEGVSLILLAIEPVLI